MGNPVKKFSTSNLPVPSGRLISWLLTCLLLSWQASLAAIAETPPSP